ncbi:MAG: WYL domain-containing protein [Polyangiaceae bacterium]
MATRRKPQQRYETLARTAKILTDLVKGKEHDSESIARLGHHGRAAAHRQMKELAKCPGVSTARRGRKTVLVFDPSQLVPPPTFPEVIAACLGTSLARVFQGSDYERNMRGALKYLVQRARRRADFANIERKFLFVAQGGEVALPDRSGILDDAIEAVLHSKKVRLEYQRYGGKVEVLDICPLSIAIYDHQLYVIGRDSRHPAYAYRFGRIRSLEELPEDFQYPSPIDYDPERVFHDSFGIFISDTYPIEDIKLRLSQKSAVYASTHRWHRSQRTEANGDGSVTVHLRVKTCPELEMWILGLGEDAEVLEPRALRDRIATRIGTMLSIYQEAAPQPEQLDLFVRGR